MRRGTPSASRPIVFFRMIAGTFRTAGTCSATLIDPALRCRRDRLVRRHRVDRKKTRRVASQPVERDHSDPPVDGIQVSRALQQPRAQCGDLAQSVRMVERQQIGLRRVGDLPREVDPREAIADRGDRWWIQPRRGQHRAERVDVVGDRRATHERGLYGSRAPARKWIVNTLAGHGQALDEKCWKLGLEAGAVTDLVNAVAAPLAGSPESVDEMAQTLVLQLLGRSAVERIATKAVEEVPRRPRPPDRRFRLGRAELNRQRRNGLFAFSVPIVEPGPWPQMNVTSSPSGSSLVLIALISAAWSP